MELRIENYQRGIDMIVGHGIDIESIQSIEEAYQRHPRFATKVLTETERARFDQLSGKRKMEYLAGRWSAKEAFSKAWGTGIGPVGFQDLEILTNQKGAPYFSKAPFSGKIWVSISHSGDLVSTSVILEERNES